MNIAYWHLVINHLPLVFPLAGAILLMIGLIFRSEVSKRNAYLLLILGATSTMLAMATGEGAEENLSGFPRIAKTVIQHHEEVAGRFATLSYLLGVTALCALVLSFKTTELNRIMPFFILPLVVITLYYAQSAGETGSKIRHTEIQTPPTSLSGKSTEAKP